MAKTATKLIDEMIDDDPDTPTAVAVLDKPKPKPKAPEPFPWGWLVKHPGYGALRVRRDEASNEAEAIEVYRKRRCPHMSSKQLESSGLRMAATKFIPADTEKGK